MKINTTSLPAGFTNGMNNLMYILSQENSKNVTLVDPGYPEIINNYLKEKNLIVTDILITHHHFDHTDGVASILENHKNVSISGSENSSFNLITNRLKDNQEFSVKSLDSKLQVLATPGHCQDHISYYIKEDKLLFAGDAIFGAGCGLILDGTAQELKNSLHRITTLPDDTTLYYGHDYTIPNLEFARKIEPSNNDIINRLSTAKKIKKNVYLNYSTVSEELKTNPFLRVNLPEIKCSCENYSNKSLNTDLEVFTIIRKWQ